jgi:hypothetical protein
MAFGATGVVTDVVESADPRVLQTKLAASFAAQLLDDPATELVEIALAGGGAGGVLQATIYYSTAGETTFPPLVDQHVKVIFGSDRKTVFDKLAAFYADPDVDRTTFVEKVAQGDGIQWVDLIVYTLTPRGPGLLAEDGNTAPDGAGITAPAAAPPEAQTDFTARDARRARRLRKG